MDRVSREIELERRQLDEMPFDMMFYVDENHQELCHSTGYEVKIRHEWEDVFEPGVMRVEDQWWNEYEDSDGYMHYGR